MPLLDAAIGTAINTGLGLMLEKHNDKRQIRQQGALQNLQIAGQKEMTDYNMSKQLQMWKDTNYKAQVEELEKAGLNPGLLYGMGGGGGTTTGQANGNVQGANAPQGGMEIQKAMELSLIDAQRRNIEADTKDKLANLPNKEQDVITKDLANKWETWKQSHNPEGYKIIDGKTYDKDGNEISGQMAKTWKEAENKMSYDKTFNEIEGILKDNAIKDENLDLIKNKISEIGQNIELMKKQGLNVDEATKNLEKEGKIKDFEIEMNKFGLNRFSINDLLKVLLYKL
ncbi:MAG: DNA pilot protein [Microviridae sp.]|nr:MAG: DNA pilot protein [Microviridae sp.]